MKVVIDCGNYNFKVFSAERGTFSFSSRCRTNFEPNPTAFERIEFNGQLTFIGTGELNQEYTKVNKECLTPQILYALAQASTYSDIELALLLPINQLPLKDKLIEAFKETCYEFKCNGIDRSIYITKVCVLPECAVSVNMLPIMTESDLIIDIGSRTTQVTLFRNEPVTRTVHIEKNATEKIGIVNLYEEIMNRANADGGDYEVEDIEMQLQRGTIKADEIIYKNFLKQVLNKIKTKVNLKNSHVTFTGGGSLVLKDIIKTIPGVDIMDNCIYSNVLGAYEIVKQVWSNGDKN